MVLESITHGSGLGQIVLESGTFGPGIWFIWSRGTRYVDQFVDLAEPSSVM